jgi:hypothetical protein
MVHDVLGRLLLSVVVLRINNNNVPGREENM